MAGCPGSRARLQLVRVHGLPVRPHPERSRRCRTVRRRRRLRLAHEPPGGGAGGHRRRVPEPGRRRRRPAGRPRPAAGCDLVRGRRRRLEGPGQRGLPGRRRRSPDRPRPGRRGPRPGRGRPVRARRPPRPRPGDLGPRPAPRRLASGSTCPGTPAALAPGSGVRSAWNPRGGVLSPADAVDPAAMLVAGQAIRMAVAAEHEAAAARRVAAARLDQAALPRPGLALVPRRGRRHGGVPRPRATTPSTPRPGTARGRVPTDTVRSDTGDRCGGWWVGRSRRGPRWRRRPITWSPPPRRGCRRRAGSP